MSTSTRIPDEVLSEQWFGFVHSVVARLQAAHRESGVTQKEIGARIGKAPAVVSRCLSGQQNMTIRTMYELARGMGYRIEVSFQRLDKLQRANRQPVSPILPAAAATKGYAYIDNTPQSSGTAVAIR
jgi:transcriptional regulator with XRE-family HTH domain